MLRWRLFSRSAPWIVLATIAVLPILLVGVAGALRSDNNDVRQWLPAGFEETRQYDWFLKQFGSDEMVVASWPGASLTDPRLDRLAAALGPYIEPQSDASADLDPSAGKPKYFRHVLTGRTALDQLTSAPANLPTPTALNRLRGSLVGVDGKTSAVVAMLGPVGMANRHAVVGTIRNAAEQAGVPPAELRLGGPTVDSVALDTESLNARYSLAVISLVVSLLLAWWCLRQARLVAMVFAVALLSAGAAVALVYYTGNTMSLLLISMPTLFYVLAMSGAIHLTNYYREAMAQSGRVGAAERALVAAWLPCALSAGTTAVGLGSLSISQVVPVRLFGIYSAAGVLISLPLLFLLLPSLLELWPVRPVSAPARQSDRRGRWMALSGLEKWRQQFVRMLVRKHAAVSLAFAAAMAVALVGLARLETSVKLIDMFSPRARIIQDYAWLERHLGPLVPIELVVRFDEAATLSVTDRVRLIGAIQNRLEETEKVGGTMSAATFVPPLAEIGGLRGTATRRVVERRFERAAAGGQLADFLRHGDDGQLWRVSARVEALNDLDYGRFLRDLRAEIQPIVDRWPGLDPSHVDVTYTGVVPLVYKAQRTLMSDLTSSFFGAFAIIGLVMIVMLRSFVAGMASMLPNVLPALLVFGGMAWGGWLLDIGSMMTASVAMGMAVDGTVHYVGWFRRGMEQGLSRPAAIEHAFRHCSTAMSQATFICGFGLLVFGLSSFVPTARFAWLMFGMLGVSLLGDLVQLPALLAGRLGRAFEPKRSPASGEQSEPGVWLSAEPGLATAEA